MNQGRNANTRESQQALIRRLAWLLDSSIRIPGTQFRIGLDAIIGLIPWAGDVVGSVLSFGIIGLAFQMGASRWTLLRMGFNVLVELVVGAIPVFGDVFDAVYKANEKNVRLLERSVTHPRAQRKDFWFVSLIGLVLLTALGLSIYGTYQLTLWIWSSISQWNSW
ncbi:MAG TPA: DUF4112 domain-containing protein [Oligoflexus sp.]|uniref:DUF4112 domain-containing protein n=1 Tax=Oligoflexus sp. TaxID=1971216 RepID=UPI002D7ED222|nr:DUF4112 domain-containing protein [Oligoflexus sp.]HET9237235.1 DUF4112 domain-containing protein [Oligoflexus sp.]